MTIVLFWSALKLNHCRILEVLEDMSMKIHYDTKANLEIVKPNIAMQTMWLGHHNLEDNYIIGYGSGTKDAFSMDNMQSIRVNSDNTSIENMEAVILLPKNVIIDELQQGMNE